jgi:hypothetical protein
MYGNVQKRDNHIVLKRENRTVDIALQNSCCNATGLGLARLTARHGKNIRFCITSDTVFGKMFPIEEALSGTMTI